MNRHMKTLGVLLALFLLFTLFAGCQKESNVQIAATDYLAQGTIPAAAKIYPICDEDLPMVVAYKTDTAQQYPLTDADINEITAKIDKYVAALANSAAEDYVSDDLDFLVGMTNEDIAEMIENRNTAAMLNGCQIVTLTGLEKDRAEAVVLLNATLMADGLEHINLWYVGLQKTGNTWYILGSQAALTGLASEYDISRDVSTGQIVCTPLNKGGN